MANQILFDKLIFIDRLKRAGVTDDQARAHAEAIDEALREAIANKAGIVALKSENEHKFRQKMRRETYIALAIILAGSTAFGALIIGVSHLMR